MRQDVKNSGSNIKEDQILLPTMMHNQIIESKAIDAGFKFAFWLYAGAMTIFNHI